VLVSLALVTLLLLGALGVALAARWIGRPIPLRAALRATSAPRPLD